jgi:hypothetical protein
MPGWMMRLRRATKGNRPGTSFGAVLDETLSVPVAGKGHSTEHVS